MSTDLVGHTAFSILPVPTGPVGAAAADPHDSNILYLGGSEGLFRSADGGNTWALLSRELRYPHVLLVDPSEPGRLYVARRDLTSFLPLPGVFRSTDGGATWDKLAAGLGAERIFALALAPHRRGTLYAGSWAGRVYKSVDGGDTWSPAASEPVRASPRDAAETVGQLAVSPVDGALYALEPYGGAFKSTDEGATWQQVNADSGWLAIDPQRGDLYLAGRRLQHSTDGGRTWADISAGLPYNPQTGGYATYWIAVDPDSLIFYTRYHRSTDGGASWESLPTPANFVPRLLVPGKTPVIYGSINGQAGRYRDNASSEPFGG